MKDETEPVVFNLQLGEWEKNAMPEYVKESLHLAEIESIV